ncbi:DeoR/GlpR family DNA-binding transcription regulator [Varibaculum vaginae]|uniref:DeoR/GlpR family DNA-binding transcription regulator n=1 Tax=Varibaculum vaginae TaxID=2364797 RepID=UPI0013589D3E|nr:DeoR/GlpR family DNA-binding transcription regulator [Varibaculum vaginae]
MPVHSGGRRLLIEQALCEFGQVNLKELAQRFKVSDETIRRDLEILSDQGKVKRVYGGAVSVQKVPESQLAERMKINGEEKRKIARLALSHIPEGAFTVFLDSGSSTAYFAELLPDRADLLLVTNSAAIATAVAARTRRLKVHLIGGTVRESTLATVGALTVQAVRSLHPDLTFLGSNGFDPLDGYTTPDIEEAAVKRAMVQCSRRAVVLADAGKYGHTSTVQFAAPDEIEMLISDQRLAKIAGKDLKKLAKDVFLA